MALADVLRDVWTQSFAPHDWRHANLVPVPKKGDLRQCENWRGIALFDVVGKLCGRIIQNQLRWIVENEMPEPQCGFRVGRGCPDAVFCASQLTEKAYEHHCKLFLIFIDLHKACESVPRTVLWIVLAKLGVHPDLVSLIIEKDIVMRMVATVRVAGGCSQSIQVRNGLRQGCVIAPVLFNQIESIFESICCGCAREIP